MTIRSFTSAGGQERQRVQEALKAVSDGTADPSTVINKLSKYSDSADGQLELLDFLTQDGTVFLNVSGEEADRAVEMVRGAIARQTMEAIDAQYGPVGRKVFLVGIGEEEISTSTPSGIVGVTGVVPFEVQPVISESGTALYTEINDIRQAGSIMIYMGSPGREISINATFISRSREEAAANRKYVQLLRSWRLPEKEGTGLAVRSPSRLRLSGYGKWLGSTDGISKGIPVRLTNLSIDMPDDTDYLQTQDGEYHVPIVWKVNISLKETRSINELEEFDIVQFRKGILDGW